MKGDVPKARHLKVNPIREDVGDKPIGGFAQSKGDGDRVPEQTRTKYIEFAAKLRQHRPNDGKDGGIPGDAGELLGLADDLDAAMFSLKSFSRLEETVEVTT